MKDSINKWFLRLLSAIISGAASSIGLLGIDYMSDVLFNWKRVLAVFIWGGIIGMVNYIKQHPLEQALD